MIKKILFGRQLCLTFAVLGAVMAILPASAVEPIPTFDVIVTPALLTKSGNPAVVTNEYDLPGAIRDRFYNIYERFWKEQSYYSVNPTTGRPANGVWMRPYVKGYVHVPWPMAKAMDTNNLPSWMWQYPCDYTKFDYDGELPYTGVARHRREENWEVPPRGAPPGTLGQLFVDTNQAPANPLLDGVWTPGEAFYDANSNGVYDLGRVAEDRWWADNKLPILFRTNWPGIPKINDYNSTNAGTTNWDSRRGEIYVDYNSNTLVDSQGRIQTVGFDPAVEIWIQSGTNPYMNARVTVSEFNFTPHLVESNGPAYHGDFYHTYVPGHPGDQADIPTNRLFDFNVNLMTGRNLVYRALDRNGNPILLTYQMWVVVSNGLPYEGTNALTDNALLTDVKVPAYQASELFGAFYSAVGNLRSYTDTIAPYVTNRLFTNGVSGVWDDEVPTEPFEDFLSWWVPDRGTGMAGGWSYLDVPGAVVRSDYLNELTGRASRTDRIEPLTWDDYEDYITLNYQGNVASLLARATNGVYDGPDNWNELTNYMYQWSGYISVLEAKTPLNTGHWYFGAYGDFDTWRLAYWPLATNAMTWFPADQIPNIVEYDPGDSKTNANCVEYGKIIGTKAYVPGGGWKPCLNMGWSYDNVIEFCDMPSSLYHSAGEGRLGEITSPWSHSLYGQNVVADPFDASDKTILLGGPRATGVFGDNGRDAGNLLSLEVYTWGKPEYRGATDGNLNGMIDQGESRIGYPSYSCDDDSITVNGADSLYPFNYKYLIEDVMEIWDWFTVGGITGSFYNFTCYPTIVDNPRGVKGRTTGLGKCSFTSVSRTGGTAGGGCQVMVTAGMQGLSHEQGHYCFGFPDFYDVDSKDGAVLINYPMAGYTIMEGGAKWVHDCPYDKNGVGWISDQPLAQDGWGNASRGILVENGGPVTLELYPMEANRNAYFYFNRIGSYYDDPSGKAAQRLWIWYSDASSMFSYLKPQDNNGNSFNGIYMMTVDTTFPIRGFQLGTLINAKMVQASGKDELVAGVQRGVSREDMFPGTTDNRSYSADTLPSARWQDGHDMGFRVNDFVLPSKTGDPAQVTLEWYDPRKPWPVPWWGSDKNSNSIPDLWEFHWFSGLGTATATSDFDLDRLPDWAEWLSNTDPRSPGSYEQDADNDGLNNGEETIRFKTNPLLADTDDDGVNDRLDLTNSWPTNALSPAVDRVLSLDGQTNSYVLMPGSQGRFKLNDWTIMAWVKPSANCNNGLIISRDAGNNNFNYCLGLTNGPKPFVKFSASPSSNEVRVLSSANLPLNRWSHIAGVFDSESGELSLYVDGNRVAYTVTGDRPAWNMDVSQQPGWSGQKVGQGFAGWIDEVGIFNQALARNEIEDMKSGIFWQTNALVAYYRFDDGTSATNNNGTWSGTSGRGDWNWGQVEDFAPGYANGWTRMWRNAGTLKGQAEMVLAPSDAPVRLRERDSDGDGMPDWWELAHGLDPFSAVGVNGAWGDPDNDGLNNRAEYLAGTDPHNWDTFNTGLGDYDSRSGTHTRTYGEMYMDGDGMPDTWEVQYGLDPYHYDAHLDLDKDGWSNYAEYQAGTDPSNPYNYPWPTIWGSANYFGNQSGMLHFFAYQINTMDGEPKVTKIGTDSGVYETIGQADGSTVFNGRLPIYPIDNTTEVQISANVSNMVVIFTFTGPGQYTYNGPGTDYAANLDYTDGGFILRWASVAVPAAGENVNIAYSFVNRNAAVFSLNGFSEGDVYLLALMDLNSSDTFDAGEPLGIMEDQPLTLGYTSLSGVRIQVKDSAPGYGRFAWTASSTTTDYPVVVNKISESGSPNVLARSMHWSRNYVHEWDYQLAGLYGLSAGSYQWWMNNQNGTFSVTWPAAVSPPYLVYPRGEKLNYAVNQFKWAMDPNSTMYHLQVARQASDRGYAFVINEYYPVPYCDGDGVSQAELPLYAGELGDGVYAWRVASWSPAGESAWSDPQTFTISLAATNSYWIGGGVYYFGKADSANIIVEAYDNKGYSGKPEARVLLSGAARTNSYKGLFALRGLEAGTYYVRAYLDVTPAGGARDSKRNSPWESWGFIRVPTNSYEPRAIALVNTMFVDGTTLVIHDCDTDNDLLPDAWEMYYFGNLDQTGDMDYDGDGETNLEEYMRDGYDHMNPASWDTDGDGLSDGFEFNYNPWSSGYRAKAGQQLNPALWDTDGDGYSDGAELRRYHTDPLDSGSYPGYQPMCFDAFRSPADYDGDGRTDMAVYDIANGDWYLMTGGGQFFTLPFGTAATMPMVGDYNGDGRDDFAVFDSATGAWHLYNAWSGQSFSLKFGDSEMIPVPADYDGDGRTDLAVYYPAEGMWYIYSVLQGQLINLQFGGPTMMPVPGDYNGDGGADLAVFEPATGDWNIFTYHLYTHQVQCFSGNFGGPTMVPVPGDYDGDGRNDIVLFDSSTGNWYILTWKGQYLSGQFGWYGCIPVAGDYDGDGRSDICVYYPPSGMWYIYCWTGRSYQVQLGWSSTVPVLKGR